MVVGVYAGSIEGIFLRITLAKGVCRRNGHFLISKSFCSRPWFLLVPSQILRLIHAILLMNLLPLPP